MNPKNNGFIKSLITIFCVVSLISFVFFSYSAKSSKNKIEEVTYNQFIKMVEEKKVKEATINLSEESKFTFKDNANKEYTTDNPKINTFKEFLLKNGVKVEEISSNGGAITIIMTIMQAGLTILLFVWLSKKIMPQPTKDDIVENIPDITFDDIAGCQELKSDLKFVIEYLQNPSKYIEIGARMPKGIVLYGPPGTGKTLTAKALAGSAQVPFFSVSGSDFIEMYVGLGAKRVRELYKKARQKSPCIVFIDEMDAVGGHRTSNGTHSENNQTINALLNELDGFNGSEGVLTVCATNRLEDLDTALVRPGRFDKQLAVPLPEKDDRLQILQIYTKGKKMSEEVDLNSIAAMTVGFSGAAIEAMLNEAAFLAVNDDCKEVKNEHIDRAFYKMVMKGDKKENQNSRDKSELKIVAWHEAGHAFATKLYTDDSVSKVTIISSTSGAGGVTFRTPQEMSLLSKKYIENIIKTIYAGRVSESIYLKDKDKVTTGASSDIKQATKLIKEYISIYGMDDDIGLINMDEFSSIDNKMLMEKSSQIAKVLYSQVESDLKQYENIIEKIAATLLENESITEIELDNILAEYEIEYKK